MKLLIMIPATALILASLVAGAKEASQSLNSLGGNKELMRKARAVDPDNRVKIVQQRLVDRDLRLELGLNYGIIAGGDSYLRSDNLGGRVDFHINPRFSLGVMHYQSSNELTTEGKRVYDNAQAAREKGQDYRIPESDFAKETTMGIINWYPLYGKINLFNISVAQFDIYALGGYGQVKLRSGATDTYTAGAGVGFWLTQHFSTRFEARYQHYKDEIWSGSRSLNLTVLTMGIGVLL